MRPLSTNAPSLLSNIDPCAIQPFPYYTVAHDLLKIKALAPSLPLRTRLSIGAVLPKVFQHQRHSSERRNHHTPATAQATTESIRCALVATTVVVEEGKITDDIPEARGTLESRGKAR